MENSRNVFPHNLYATIYETDSVSFLIFNFIFRNTNQSYMAVILDFILLAYVGY